jgi:hypothetical protein
MRRAVFMIPRTDFDGLPDGASVKVRYSRPVSMIEWDFGALDKQKLVGK